MTTEAALKRIQQEQSLSGLSPQDYYTALAVLSRHHGMLTAALALAPHYEIGRTEAVSEVKLMEQLQEVKQNP